MAGIPLIVHNWQNYPKLDWHGAAPLGGRAKQITAGRNKDGRLEIFYVGVDDIIYHNWQKTPSGVWAGEAALGGQASDVAVAANGDGRLELFYLDLSGALGTPAAVKS